MAKVPLDVKPEEMTQVASRLAKLCDDLEDQKVKMDTLVDDDFVRNNKGSVSEELAGLYDEVVKPKLQAQLDTMRTGQSVLVSSVKRFEEAETDTTSRFRV